MDKMVSVEAVKQIISKVVEGEVVLNRKEFPKRLYKIRDEIFYKIDKHSE